MTAGTRNVVTWIVSGLLGVGFLLSGATKLFFEPAVAAERFEAFGLPGGLALFIGGCEMAGGVGVLVPRLAGLAAAGLFVIMLGAVFFHVTHDPLAHALPALVMGAMCVWVARERGILPGSDA
jgi:uncharacterized membrane protein YphA (DoxX/SURF4 family)